MDAVIAMRLVTRDEVRAVLERLDGVPRVMALLLYGAAFDSWNPRKIAKTRPLTSLRAYSAIRMPNQAFRLARTRGVTLHLKSLHRVRSFAIDNVGPLWQWLCATMSVSSCEEIAP
jgi:hypothetical protein